MATKFTGVSPMIPSEGLDRLKYEVSEEFGIQTGADQTSRNNGKVGGNMVKRLISMAKTQL